MHDELFRKARQIDPNDPFKALKLLRTFVRLNPEASIDAVDWRGVYDPMLTYGELVEVFERNYPFYRWREILTEVPEHAEQAEKVSFEDVVKLKLLLREFQEVVSEWAVEDIPPSIWREGMKRLKEPQYYDDLGIELMSFVAARILAELLPRGLRYKWAAREADRMVWELLKLDDNRRMVVLKKWELHDLRPEIAIMKLRSKIIEVLMKDVPHVKQRLRKFLEELGIDLDLLTQT